MTERSERVGAVVVAAGRGERFRQAESPGTPGTAGVPGDSAALPKQFWPLLGQPVLAWTLARAARAESINGLVVVVPREYCPERDGPLPALAWLVHPTAAWRPKLWAIVPGGATRQDSVWQGLQALPPACQWVVVQDGDRPLTSPVLYDRVVAAARTAAGAAPGSAGRPPAGGAAIAALPVRETLKRAVQQGGGWEVAQTVDRRPLWSAQTPQVAWRPWLERAFRQARAEEWEASDEAGLLERAGFPVALVEGEATNLKITYRQDLAVAEALLRAEGQELPGAERRVGMGADVHRLAAGRPLVLGGRVIPFEQGLVGHSDGDVLTHAVIDGCLGAAGLGDIGAHFPDTDPRWAGARSVDWLPQVCAALRQAGWQVEYVDAIVWAERPKLAPQRDAIEQELAHGLGIAPTQVNVKAKTGEGLGWIGQGEGMAAQAVVTLRRCSRCSR